MAETLAAREVSYLVLKIPLAPIFQYNSLESLSAVAESVWAGEGEGAGDMRSRSNFFHFAAVFGKNFKN